MRTDDLAEMLARGAAAEPRGRPGRWWLAAAVAGLVLGALLMSAWLGVQPRIGQLLLTPAWWGKAGFALAMAAAGLACAVRLARPGGERGWLWVLVLAPLAVLWSFGFFETLAAPADTRAALVFGQTWRDCPWRVAVLSIPAFVAAMAMMRRMAPTRPRLAGGAAGLFAGGVGALVYALHCPELEPAFVSVWYVLGVLIPAAAGAAIGPRLLRW